MSAWAEELSQLGKRISSVLESDLIEKLAALATFDPDVEVPADQRDAVAAVSDRLTDRDGRQDWMLKESTRVDVLARVLLRGGLAEVAVVRARAGGTRDSALQRVLDVVLKGQAVDLGTLDENELLAALRVGRWCAAAGAMARMPALGGELDREWIEGRLALIETLRPIREITAGGCIGRDAELLRLREYLGGPPHLNFTDLPPLLVYGVGGVGKSTLIAQFLLDLADRPDPVAWAYLDLDRPSLSSYDPLVLLKDLIRQVGAQFSEIRRFLDYSGSEASEASLGHGLEGVDYESWRELAPRVAGAVNDSCGGRLVVVLDTYEELQRAELTGGTRSAGESLYGMFATLADYTHRFRLVVSGRAPALTFVASKAAGGDQLLHVAAFQGRPR
jgi:cellulose synthase operon protein C